MDLPTIIKTIGIVASDLGFGILMNAGAELLTPKFDENSATIPQAAGELLALGAVSYLISEELRRLLPWYLNDPTAGLFFALMLAKSRPFDLRAQYLTGKTLKYISNMASIPTPSEDAPPQRDD